MGEQYTNKKLFSAGLVYTISTIIIKGISFLTMPIFTGILSVEENGNYITYMSYEGVVNILIACGFVFAIRSARFDFKEKDYNSFKQSLVDLELTILAVFLLVAIIFRKPLSNALDITATLLILLVLNSFGSALVTLFTQMFHIDYKIKKTVAVSSFITITSFILSWIFVKYVFVDRRDFGRILGNALPPIIFGIVVVGYYFTKKRQLVNYNYWNYSFKIGLVALPQILSENLLSQSDRIMINSMIGSYEAGIYGTINTFASITSIVLGSVSSAVVPWFYEKLSKKNAREISAFLEIYILIIGIISIGFVMISPELIRVFASRPEYWEKNNLTVIFCLTNFVKFIPVIFANVFFFYKNGKIATIGVCVSAAMNILLNYIFIPGYRYEIASITSLVATLINLIYILVMIKVYKYDYYNKLLFWGFLIFIMAVLLANLLLINTIALRYLFNTAAIIVCLILLMHNSMFKELLSTIQKRKCDDREC